MVTRNNRADRFLIWHRTNALSSSLEFGSLEGGEGQGGFWRAEFQSKKLPHCSPGLELLWRMVVASGQISMAGYIRKVISSLKAELNARKWFL